MVYCRNCGQSLPTENAKFCSNCGNATNGSDNANTTPNYISKKKGSSKKKIVGVVVGIVVAFFVIIAIAAASVPPGTLHQTDPENIQGISQFVVLEQGSNIAARFSLNTPENVYATSDASVQFRIVSGSGTELYSQNFDIKASDFAQYELRLTGQPLIAYAWFLDAPPSRFESSSLDLPEAFITVTLPNGKSFNAKTTLFV